MKKIRLTFLSENAESIKYLISILKTIKHLNISACSGKEYKLRKYHDDILIIDPPIERKSRNN